MIEIATTHQPAKTKIFMVAVYELKIIIDYDKHINGVYKSWFCHQPASFKFSFTTKRWRESV